ncbi:MAG: helix-turn-helix domain-containing protein [Clostridia bacterium]|nr:helix-turn-helix domain-containing protein [Clostridia bacterium]
MAGRTTLKLTDKDKANLKKITRSRSKEARVVSRAKILLHKADGLTIDEIAQIMKIHRNTVILCLKKYSEGGIDYALNDKPRKSVGRGHGITPEGRDWVISIASKEPQYAGLLDPSWSYEGLTSYISKNAAKAGFPELESISKTSVRRILSTADNSTLKIRRNDMSQHRHDGDVQLTIPFDDFLSPAPEWTGHGPGEQLSMSMMFDLYATDPGSEPEESPSETIAGDEDIALDEDIAADDAIEDEIEESVPEDNSPDVQEELFTEDPAEPPAEPADVPEDAPETAPVDDFPETESAIEPDEAPDTEPVEGPEDAPETELEEGPEDAPETEPVEDLEEPAE